MNNPSKHAWDLFLELNHPAQDVIKGRGLPDLKKKIGDPGRVVWETWKDAAYEVFLVDGRTPPKWEDYSLDPFLNDIEKRFEPSTALLIAQLNEDKNRDSLIQITKAFLSLSHVTFNPKDGTFEVGGGETRMNKSTFDFIVKNELYNPDGIYKFRNSYLKSPKGQRAPMTFEKESIEAKAMWRKFSVEEINNSPNTKYYVATDKNGEKYGLTSLHIITKDVPNWFWCSFRHKDGPEPSVPSVDNFGLPEQLKGTFWENYELSGTQTAFSEANGKPTLLSDPYIESGFERSSCISCHSLSVAGPPGTMLRDGGRLLFTLPNVVGNGNIGETVGAPKVEWFLDTNGEENLVQLDFLYSMSFRAKRKK